VLSLSSPVVRWNATGKPSKSVRRRTLDENALLERPERLTPSPLLVPATETEAQTTVLPNMLPNDRSRWFPPGVGKKPQTPDRGRHQNRIQALVHLPYCLGKVRQITLLVMKKCSASKSSRLSASGSPPRACAESKSPGTMDQSRPVVPSVRPALRCRTYIDSKQKCLGNTPTRCVERSVNRAKSAPRGAGSLPG